MTAEKPTCTPESSSGSAFWPRQDGAVESVSEKTILMKADGRRPLHRLSDGKALIMQKILSSPATRLSRVD